MRERPGTGPPEPGHHYVTFNLILDSGGGGDPPYRPDRVERLVTTGACPRTQAPGRNHHKPHHPGSPYELAGKRIVFSNWYYIQPGDLDCAIPRTRASTCRGTKVLSAQSCRNHAPQASGSSPRSPGRGTTRTAASHDRRDGKMYKGWTDSDYYESQDAIHWEKKAALKLGESASDGFYQVFIDPLSPPEERYKAVWVGQIKRGSSKPSAPIARRLGTSGAPCSWAKRTRCHACAAGSRPTASAGARCPIRWSSNTAIPGTQAYFDPVSREYVIYTRQWSIGPRTDRLPADIRNSWTGVGRRAIGRTASHNFRRFTPFRDDPGAEPRHAPLGTALYELPNHRARRTRPAPHVPHDLERVGGRHDADRARLQPRRQGLALGPRRRPPAHPAPFGRWDGGCIWATPNLIELPDGNWPSLTSGITSPTSTLAASNAAAKATPSGPRAALSPSRPKTTESSR